MNHTLSGLSYESRAIFDSYQQWSRIAYDSLKRGVSVDGANQQAGNMLQETYTQDEVKNILNGHTAMLLHSLDARFEQFVGSSAALLLAVLRDVDRQRMTIEIDANAVLSSGTAASIAAGVMGSSSLLEEHGRQLLGGPRGRLAPLTVADATTEASRQLAEANAEVRSLREKLHRLTDEYTREMSTRSGVAAQPLSVYGMIPSHETTTEPLPARDKRQDGDMQQLVDRLRAELAEARQELSTRLNQSTQYQQVKKILSQKNEQIKTMRARLGQYDPAFLHVHDDALVGDD